MDFGGIVRRAWQISWRYKALWVLGLFAGTTGGFSGWGGSGHRFDQSSASEFGSWAGINQGFSDAGTHIETWAPLLAAVLVLLVLVGLLWMVLSVAAQAGLAYEVDEIERGRPASARTGWSVGFHYWGRVVLASLVLMLPIVLLTLVVVSIAVVGILAAMGGWGGAIVGLLLGLAALGVVLIPVLIVLSFVLTNMYVLSVRYIALENRTVGEALSASWGAIRHRFKDVFLMWLLTLVLSIGFGFVVALPVGTAVVGAVVSLRFGAWAVAAILGLVLIIAVVLLGAFWGTYTSAVWTLFFRALTGRDTVAAQPAYAGGSAGAAPFAVPGQSVAPAQPFVPGPPIVSGPPMAPAGPPENPGQ